MPGIVKHVHFDDRTNTQHLYTPCSPMPATPSPTYSTSSLDSSSGPITPPSSNAFNAPLPPTFGNHAPVQINPLLGFHAYSPKLSYDVSFPPDTSSATATGAHLSQHETNDHATYPPLPKLEVCHELLPWTITIRASHPERGVSCADVLETLYRTLRRPVTPAEFDSLPSPDMKKRVTSAWMSRCGRIRDPAQHENEKQKGVKRVDFLLGRHRMLGLSSTKRGPHVWVLNTSS